LSARTANPAFVSNRRDTGPLPREGSALALLPATELPGDTVGLMSENEAAAHALVRALAASDVAANASGAGVHWKVEIVPRASRSLIVHCFWYERTLSGLLLGTNPSNARSRLQRTPEPREGVEYFVIARRTVLELPTGGPTTCPPSSRALARGLPV
jgi:hypothetical protein